MGLRLQYMFFLRCALNQGLVCFCETAAELNKIVYAFFPRASRGVFPNAGLPPHVCLLKIVFFPRASRGVCFFVLRLMQALPSSTGLEWSGRRGGPLNSLSNSLLYNINFLQ